MKITDQEIEALSSAFAEIGSNACTPIRENGVLFRCLSHDKNERGAAADELATWIAHQIKEGNYNTTVRRLEKLEKAWRSMLKITPPEGYEQIWNSTGDRRQGTLKAKTREKTLMVLDAIARLVDSEGCLPTQIQIQDYLNGAVGARTVGDVVEEIEESSGLKFPDGRETERR